MRILPQALGYSTFAVFAPLVLTLKAPVRAAATADFGTTEMWIRRGTYAVMTLAVATVGIGYLAAMYNW